jgi:hypothetical protein
MLNGKHGVAVLDTYADIVADAKRARDEAASLLLKIERGAVIPTEHSPERAIALLRDEIARLSITIQHLEPRNA